MPGASPLRPGASGSSSAGGDAWAGEDAVVVAGGEACVDVGAGAGLELGLGDAVCWVGPTPTLPDGGSGPEAAGFPPPCDGGPDAATGVAPGASAA